MTFELAGFLDFFQRMHSSITRSVSGTDSVPVFRLTVSITCHYMLIFYTVLKPGLMSNYEIAHIPV